MHLAGLVQQRSAMSLALANVWLTVCLWSSPTSEALLGSWTPKLWMGIFNDGGLQPSGRLAYYSYNGLVVTDPRHPAYLGAHTHTNKTAQLSGFSEMIKLLAETLPFPRQRIRHFPTSTVNTQVTSISNLELCLQIRRLFLNVAPRLRVQLKHVFGQVQT